MVRAPAEGGLVRYPLSKAQPRPPLRMLGEELDEASLGVRDAEVEEEPAEEEARGGVDGGPPRALWVHCLEDVAQLLLEDRDQIL